MSDSDFWQRLQQDWQSDSPPIDLAILERQVQDKRRRMIAMQIVDVLVAVAAIGSLINAFQSTQQPRLHLLFEILFAAVLAATAVGLWLRWPDWKPQSMGTEDLLHLSMRRARTGLRFVWFNLVGLAVLDIVGAIFLWHLPEDTLSPDVAAIQIAFNGSFFILVVVWAIWYGRRQHSKLRHAQRLLDQLENESGGD